MNYRPLADDSFWTPKRLDRWTWWFVALGTLALSVRYLLRFPLFLDEAFLSANFLDRGPAGLMGPLEYWQVCPLGFLWVQWTIQHVAGFTEYSLRLFPFLCGVAGIVAFRHLAGLTLPGTSRLLAVGIFSVSYPLVRYASQAKPYSGDVLVAVLLLIAAVKWCANPRSGRWLWIAAASLPLLLSLSFAPVFVAGAISLTPSPSSAPRRSTLVNSPPATYHLPPTSPGSPTISRSCPPSASSSSSPPKPNTMPAASS